ncbi:TPA: hypothetical protein ACKPZ6_003859 [Serratia liquefaciens]
MWEQKRLHIPENLQGVTCSTVVAHPWVFGLGQEEDSGFYLSPPNAVNYLVTRLAGASVRQDVTVILLAAPTLAAFVAVLTTAAEVFPIAPLTQVQRRAKTAISLATSRMQLPAVAGGLPPAVPLSVSTTRQAVGAQSLIQAIADAAAPSTPEGITAALAEFTRSRAALLDAAKEGLAQLQAGNVDVWAVSAIGDTQTAARLMREGVPEADRVFTLALMFVGDDLAPLRTMLGEL